MYIIGCVHIYILKRTSNSLFLFSMLYLSYLMHKILFFLSAAGADFNIPLASMNNIPLASMNVSRSHPRACMTIEIVDDTVMEDEEEFILILTADNALSVVTHPNSTNVIILDDDDTF